jgi:hypothetical protein
MPRKTTTAKRRATRKRAPRRKPTARFTKKDRERAHELVDRVFDDGGMIMIGTNPDADGNVHGSAIGKDCDGLLAATCINAYMRKAGITPVHLMVADLCSPDDV